MQTRAHEGEMRCYEFILMGLMSAKRKTRSYEGEMTK